jgi:hypothetical protein
MYRTRLRNFSPAQQACLSNASGSLGEETGQQSVADACGKGVADPASNLDAYRGHPEAQNPGDAGTKLLA